MPDPTRRLISENYPSVATELLEPLLTFVNLARELVEGDMDKILLVLVIAVRTTQHPEFARIPPERLDRGEIPVLPSLGINVRSIADSTGVPKETARRKVQELVEAGWFVRTDNDLRFTAKGYLSVAPAREAIEGMAARYFDVVARLKQRQDS